MKHALVLLLMISHGYVMAQPAAISPTGDAGRNHIRDFGLKNYIHLSKELPQKSTESWDLVCEMPYNCQFQPWIEIRGKNGAVIRLNSTNPLVRYLTRTESFVSGQGHQVYQAANWISGEGAIYSIPPGVEVLSVKYRETGYDTKFAGSFSCNDQDYNILWKKGARTAYLCMRDHFYDCPDRERVGFWGDGTPELDQCFYAFDSSAHRLCRDLVLRKLDPEFYPGQQLEFLGEYGLWYYYMQTGDLASLVTVYPSTREFLFNVYKPGKKNQWFDWGKENKDIAVIETCFMYIDLGALKKMAQLTGHQSDTVAINQRMDSIRESFDRRFWKGNAYRSDQVSQPDDRANAMAINAGLAGRATWETIYRTVLSQKTYASCFFDRWVFEALCKMGRQREALLRMSDRYRSMIRAPFTTLWEHYDRWWASVVDAFDEGSSLNHGWNPPVINLSQDIAGISPVKPGWELFSVLPREAFLRRVHVSVPSVKGAIDMSLHKTTTHYDLQLGSPAGTMAMVGIPKKSFKTLQEIKVNNRLVWKGAVLDTIPGLSHAGENEEYILFLVKAGRWHFQGLGTLGLELPKKIPRPVKAERKLDKRNWTASASVPDNSFLFSGDSIPIDVSARNVLDGDHWTGWRDMGSTQHSGQFLMVDMKSTRRFDKIVLDNTWALWDSPRAYSLSVSVDGKHWKGPVVRGEGQLGITTLNFPAQTARYIKINQTGQDSSYHWSVYELDVYQAP